MIKTILVPASGSEKDLVVFGTALKAAQIHHAHLAFYHLHPSVGDALVHEPHTGFALGKALRNLRDDLVETHDRRALLAEHHVRDFCARSQIRVTDTPLAVEAVTASWRGGDFGNEYRLIAKARSHDLVVMGRFTEPNGLPADLLQLVLIECGRPILIAADKAPHSLTGTVMVCWKDAAGPARAISVAMPILAKADRVMVVAVDEGDEATADLRLRLPNNWRGTVSRLLPRSSPRTGFQCSRRCLPLRKSAAPIFWSWAGTARGHCGRRSSAVAPIRCSRRRRCQC